jgi:hypothetical protein
MEALMSIKTSHIGRFAILVVVLALAGPADVVHGASSPLLAQAATDEYLRAQRQVRDQSRRALADFLRVWPDPSHCKLAFQLGRKQFVVALSRKAEQVGLRRGDLVKTVAGLPIATNVERSQVHAALSAAKPVEVVIERKGQASSISLPCAPESEVWTATKRALEAATGGVWDECQAAALDAVRARGFTTSYPLYLRMRCASVQWVRQSNRDTDLRFARATYEWQRANIRESSYEPDGLDEIRTQVLSSVTLLTREGFTDYANALEDELRLAPQSVAQEE